MQEREMFRFEGVPYLHNRLACSCGILIDDPQPLGTTRGGEIGRRGAGVTGHLVEIDGRHHALTAEMDTPEARADIRAKMQRAIDYRKACPNGPDIPPTPPGREVA